MEFYFTQIGAVLMLSFVTFSLSYSINKSANRYLAILFGVVSVMITLSLLGEYFFEEWFVVDVVNESIKFLIPAFLYLSVYHFVNAPKHFIKKHYVVFVPFIVVTMVLMLLNSTETTLTFLENSYEMLDVVFIIAFIICFVTTFCIVIKMLLRHRKTVLKLHANKQGVTLDWLYRLLLVFPLLLIIYLVFEMSSEENYAVSFSNGVLFIILFYCGFHIVQQREIFDVIPTQQLPEEDESFSKSDLKKEALIDENLALEIANKLDKLMIEEKPFLNKNLSLALLAEKLNTRTHILSFVINTHHNVNFYAYINMFRLAHCKALLKNPKKQHLSMEGVAYEGGFGSKSTFNTLFKKQIGITPIQYKKAENQ